MREIGYRSGGWIRNYGSILNRWQMTCLNTYVDYWRQHIILGEVIPRLIRICIHTSSWSSPCKNEYKHLRYFIS